MFKAKDIIETRGNQTPLSPGRYRVIRVKEESAELLRLPDPKDPPYMASWTRSVFLPLAILALFDLCPSNEEGSGS
jgi:hypothetical protein